MADARLEYMEFGVRERGGIEVAEMELERGGNCLRHGSCKENN